MRRLLDGLIRISATAAVLVWVAALCFAMVLGLPMRTNLARQLLTPFSDVALAHAAAHANGFGLILWQLSMAVPVALMLLCAVLMLVRRILFANASTPT